MPKKEEKLIIDDELLKNSLIKFPDSSNNFDDIVQISENFLIDKYIYKLGISSKLHSKRFWESLATTLSELPNKPNNVKSRYFILGNLRYNLHISRGCVNGDFAKLYVKITEGLLGFRGALSYREAGVIDTSNVARDKTSKIQQVLNK